ncbi:MAG: glycosyltransferase [Bifidobacteriaceae bacterium]|jgi:galactofuranosylgalactofuranosylrhamnosyl-N-acetylglucosaminyl-diphospho-decaprenol beta-1,5/1,6-galactofuranosyltransferase|nr:glycosyltransferase [Bifidobacteriaceae bacterium]MCI1979433.1 glycosyltransferase [Bifidobacteriaceae bacterium]
MAQASKSSGNAVTAPQWETVYRIAYPLKDMRQVMPLYLTHPDGSSLDAVDYMINDRFSVSITAGTSVSLCTYFGAFPASYWRHWTPVRAVKFSIEAHGSGKLTVKSSDVAGNVTTLHSITVDADSPTLFSYDVSLGGFDDGGYLWFDAETQTNLTLGSAQWAVPVSDRREASGSTLSVAITTFNRAPYCLNQLETLSNEPSLRERLDTIYCVDQGTDLVRDQPGFPQVSEALGTQLKYLRQRNLGGSGGFSRGMYETLKAGTSDYVLLLDDDAISEPESILRAVQFADYTTSPLLVGGGMLSLDDRTVLHAQGERLDTARMWMEAPQNRPYDHDFAEKPLIASPLLHQRAEADHNGWWMCLIPTAVVRSIGLSLPIFIKFDDIEYGLRAKEAGYPTVSLPGAAVWHQAWAGKDIARSWEEYFIQRNRWICALLHSPKPSPWFRLEMISSDLYLATRLLYSGIALTHRGLRDIMRGPEYVVSTMPDTLSEINAYRSTFPDTQYAELSEFPTPLHPFNTPREVPKPLSAAQAILLGKDGAHDARPQTVIPTQYSGWEGGVEAFNGISSALVASPDGSSYTWLRRDNQQSRKLLKEGLRMSNALIKRWSKVSASYRSADLASFTTWKKIFDATK